jgi:N-terminal domain of anti-restriction factor ArdC/IrrE N-terminal-like domain
MPRNSHQLTAEARQAKLDGAHQRLVDALGSLTSTDDWRRWLDTMHRFHAYSAANCLMILCQRTDATRVAGFGTWKSLGRSLKKGAKGIAIWAPVTRRVTAAEESDEEQPTLIRRVGFKLAYVFDVADTEGDALPEQPGRAVLLEGEAPTEMVEALAHQVADAGFVLRYEPTIAGHAKAHGLTDFAYQTVTIATDGRSPAAQAKTLAHELAHVLLHRQAALAGIDRERAEVEAESVAYLVCAAYGLDAMDYSLGYVAHWSRGDQDRVLATAATVRACAAGILDRAGHRPSPAARRPVPSGRAAA